MHNQNNFMGKEFFWWQGVVEDRHDEFAEDGLRLGRVRVRIIGIHSPFYDEDKPNGEGIRVDQLRWAYPMMPITSANVDGIGQTPMGPVEGTWVFGFSRDGEFSQDLIIMGTTPSFQREAKNPKFEGFCDPELSKGFVPLRPEAVQHAPPYPSLLGESSVNRLARNELPHEIIAIKEEQRIPFLFCPIALDGFWWQPELDYEALYPYNHVRESESGHIEEWDDTPEHTRTHRYHKSGSYVETYENGDRTQQTVGSDHETIFRDKHVMCLDDLTLTAVGDIKIMSLFGNVDIQALTRDVNIVAARAINEIAPLINQVSETHTITTGALIISAGITNLTTGVFNIYCPVTFIYGSLFVEMHTQSGTIATGLLHAGFIVTGGCSGC
jgi:hypothetical protein